LQPFCSSGNILYSSNHLSILLEDKMSVWKHKNQDFDSSPQESTLWWFA